MGITFLDSILALLTACMVVFSAYLVGHALSSEHAAWAWISAAALLPAGALLGWFTAKRIRGFAERRGEEPRRS